MPTATIQISEHNPITAKNRKIYQKNPYKPTLKTS